MPHRRSTSPYVTAVSGVSRERVKGRAHTLPSSLLQLLCFSYSALVTTSLCFFQTTEVVGLVEGSIHRHVVAQLHRCS